MRNSLHSFVMREAAVCSRMNPKVLFERLTCSPRGRARTGGGRNNEWWKREVFHIKRNGVTTLCGIDCSDWLDIGWRSVRETISDRNCCSRCAARIATGTARIEEADGDGR